MRNNRHPFPRVGTLVIDWYQTIWLTSPRFGFILRDKHFPARAGHFGIKRGASVGKDTLTLLVPEEWK